MQFWKGDVQPHSAKQTANKNYLPPRVALVKHLCQQAGVTIVPTRARVCMYIIREEEEESY